MDSCLKIVLLDQSFAFLIFTSSLSSICILIRKNSLVSWKVQFFTFSVGIFFVESAVQAPISRGERAVPGIPWKLSLLLTVFLRVFRGAGCKERGGHEKRIYLEWPWARGRKHLRMDANKGMLCRETFLQQHQFQDKLLLFFSLRNTVIYYNWQLFNNMSS